MQMCEWKTRISTDEWILNKHQSQKRCWAWKWMVIWDGFRLYIKSRTCVLDSSTILSVSIFIIFSDAMLFGELLPLNRMSKVCTVHVCMICDAFNIFTKYLSFFFNFSIFFRYFFCHTIAHDRKNFVVISFFVFLLCKIQHMNFFSMCNVTHMNLFQSEHTRTSHLSILFFFPFQSIHFTSFLCFLQLYCEVF